MQNVATTTTTEQIRKNPGNLNNKHAGPNTIAEQIHTRNIHKLLLPHWIHQMGYKSLMTNYIICMIKPILLDHSTCPQVAIV